MCELYAPSSNAKWRGWIIARQLRAICKKMWDTGRIWWQQSAPLAQQSCMQAWDIAKSSSHACIFSTEGACEPNFKLQFTSHSSSSFSSSYVLLALVRISMKKRPMHRKPNSLVRDNEQSSSWSFSRQLFGSFQASWLAIRFLQTFISTSVPN